MEKSKKNEKGLNRILFLGEIGPNGWKEDFVATPAQCAKIAERFEIPAVKSLQAHVAAAIDGDLIRVFGHIKADLERTCVVSLDLCKEVLDTDFEALFAENIEVIKDGEMTDDVEPVDRGRLDIFEIIAEQVGLNMNPFPHKVDISGDYIEEKGTKNRPFANLKNLIKKD
ncbi:MAG: DUF177 domain-containing protein [Alphaproteobacteria bacterium]|nr:DUF177 domain-containing protein [Alphaproteobacteria bacterium]